MHLIFSSIELKMNLTSKCCCFLFPLTQNERGDAGGRASDSLSSVMSLTSVVCSRTYRTYIHLLYNSQTHFICPPPPIFFQKITHIEHVCLYCTGVGQTLAYNGLLITALFEVTYSVASKKVDQLWVFGLRTW